MLEGKCVKIKSYSMSLKKFLKVIIDSVINTEKGTWKKDIILMLRRMDMKKKTKKEKLINSSV